MKNFHQTFEQIRRKGCANEGNCFVAENGSERLSMEYMEYGRAMPFHALDKQFFIKMHLYKYWVNIAEQ